VPPPQGNREGVEMIENIKKQLDSIVAEILRDVSGVNALRYYTDLILAIPEIAQGLEKEEIDRAHN